MSYIRLLSQFLLLIIDICQCFRRFKVLKFDVSNRLLGSDLDYLYHKYVN